METPITNETLTTPEVLETLLDLLKVLPRHGTRAWRVLSKTQRHQTWDARVRALELLEQTLQQARKQ
jgi:hypothetical protein